jgi:galactokinase
MLKTLRDVSMQQLVSVKGELSPLFFKRAMHVVGEDERVYSGMKHLEKNAVEEFGNLLYQSHESSMHNFENSCRELDVLVDIAREVDGVYGARLTGGGFGGATLTLLNGGVKEAFERTVKREYKKSTGRDTTVHFAKIADGAAIAS